MSQNKSKNNQAVSAKQLEENVIEHFKENPRTHYNANSLSSELKGHINRKTLHEVLNKLSKRDFLYKPSPKKYRLDRKIRAKIQGSSSSNVITGQVDRTKSGSAYIVPEGDNLKNDVFVTENNLSTAMHRDKVKVRVFSRKKKKPQGEVVDIVQRHTEEFVGEFHLYKNRCIVEASDGKVKFDIWVNQGETFNAENHDIVIVKVMKWPNRSGHAPLGEITSVLGQAGTNESEMKSIVIKNGFDLNFPQAVLDESKKLNGNIENSELQKRRDMRKITTFTIDPDTAKDFDDALSIEFNNDGSYEVGVHIADVTHYVQEGSALDKEALERSTSVYLVDRVIPMLPERLSNELCSLRPHEDKYTFSAVFSFDKNHNITKRWFGKTVIHSDWRFTYDEAQDEIDGAGGKFGHEVQYLNGVSNRLRKERFKKGSINFETEEVKFILDEEGHPIDVKVKERKPAHMLVEDLMLLANKEVAKHIHKLQKNTSEIPFIYRVHDEPDMDKVKEFVTFAKEMGINFDIQSPKQIVDAFNKLSANVHHNDEYLILQPLAIRTMAKAIYTTDNIGHFGLGFGFYTHFTSPIRRYADVLVHRVLYRNLEGSFRYDKEKLENKAQHISNQERSAMDAERESVKFKQAEYLNDRIGSTFTGIVSGMIEHGFFVELLGSLTEGMVAFRTLDDRYELQESGLKAIGRKSKQVIKIGTHVKVTIASVNLSRREVDMELEEIID